MQCMEGLAHGQLNIKQDNLAALWYELIHSVRSQEVLESLPGVAWLISL